MKSWTLVLLAVVSSFELHATPVLVGNPYTPYPPGCATLPELQSELYGDNRVKVFEGAIRMNTASHPPKKTSANLAVYRVACAEPNRSIIWFEFSIPEGVDPFRVYETPLVFAEQSGNPDSGWSGILVSEPNTLQSGIEPGYYQRSFGNPQGTPGNVREKRWAFILDSEGMWLPSQYNGGLKLTFNSEVIDVPATVSVLGASPGIPLNGRLSGNWAMEGIPDQGILISIAEQADPRDDSVPRELLDSRLLMFLSWYTFDAEGELLWLTGAAEFAMGATQVTVPIELVTNGQFFGSKTADRVVVGSVTLTGNSCNDLGFQYDLGEIGLGAGTRNLHRLFALETAGFPCRDLEARILENGK